jgi:hypothetical protein
MALPLIETESGRALLLNAAMTQADLGRVLQPTEFLAMMSEPWPHFVHYRGRSANYCAPDAFGFLGKYGPSACDWMVPGTER